MEAVKNELREDDDEWSKKIQAQIQVPPKQECRIM
jgi:hypothetical protein